MGIKNAGEASEGQNINLTMAQRVGAGVLMAEQVDALEKCIRDDATLTKAEKILLCRTARTNSQQNAELWEQIDTLNTELEQNALRLAQANTSGGLPRDDSSGLYAIVLLLSVVMICVSAIIIAIIV
jgi:ferric-dicitrate binding protein FerR (iron transport regulator)